MVYVMITLLPPGLFERIPAHPSLSRKGTRRMRACRQPLIASSRSLQLVPWASGMRRVRTTMSACTFCVGGSRQHACE